MRRTPYNDRPRMQRNLVMDPNQRVNSSNPKKQQINVLGNNLVAYLPAKTNTRGYHIQSKFNNRVSMHRPYTVSRPQSELKKKNQGENDVMGRRNDKVQANISGHGRSSSYNRYDKTERNELVPSNTHKQLWVNTVKETDLQNNYSHTSKSRLREDSGTNKGRIYRGSSWKVDQKSKVSIKDSRSSREASRYGQNNRASNNLTPTTKQQRNSIRKTTRNSELFSLLGNNVKEKKLPEKKVQKQDNFFEYVMRFSYRTKKGSIPSNPNKVNQDSYILSPNINGKTWQHFFGVCDGHGPLGHHVSAYIKNTLPNTVIQSKYLEKKPAESLMKAFESTYQKMIKQSNVDMSFSGSTIIACYLQHNKIYCSNVGDSRAIIGRLSSNSDKNGWSAIALSEDHKPSLPKEADRIKKMNGRVQSYIDEYGQPIGPLRVWVKNQNIPGLAMTRSFGDLVGASVGVSPVPGIKQFTLTSDDRILILASDGVFQFLSNEQIISSMSSFYQKKQIQQASDHLLNMAHRSWTRNSSIIDDITFILIFIGYEQV